MINYSTYHHDEYPDVLVIVTSGKMDMNAADFVLDCIHGYIDRGERNFVIDCEALQIMTSFGLGMLVRANSRLKENDGTIAIAAASGLVADTLRIVNFDRLFSLYPSVNEAAAELSNS